MFQRRKIGTILFDDGGLVSRRDASRASDGEARLVLQPLVARRQERERFGLATQPREADAEPHLRFGGSRVAIAEPGGTGLQHPPNHRLRSARISALDQVASKSKQHRFERRVLGREDPFELRHRRLEQLFGVAVAPGAQHAGETTLNRADAPVVGAVDALEHGERLSEEAFGFLIPASQREQRREVVHDLGDVRMLLSIQASIETERGSIQPLGLLVLSAIANHEREVVGDRGGVRVHLAQPPQIEIEHLSIEPLRFRQLPFLVEQDGQVVHRRGGLEMVGTEHLQPHVERAPRDGDRRIDLPPGAKNRLEALEVAGDLGVLGAEARLVKGERFPLELFRFVVLAAAREHGGEITQGLTHLDMVRRAGTAPHRQHVPVQPLGLVRAALVLPEPGELRHRLGDRLGMSSRDRLTVRQRTLEQRLRAIVDAKLPVDAAEQQHHVGLYFGLTREVGLDAAGTAIEEIERGDVCRVGARRIGNFEEAREEAADFARF